MMAQLLYRYTAVIWGVAGGLFVGRGDTLAGLLFATVGVVTVFATTKDIGWSDAMRRLASSWDGRAERRFELSHAAVSEQTRRDYATEAAVLLECARELRQSAGLEKSR